MHSASWDITHFMSAAETTAFFQLLQYVGIIDFGHPTIVYTVAGTDIFLYEFPVMV